MNQKLQQFEYIKNFQCLGDKCEDTCCKGWGMQVNPRTIAYYKKHAPEMLDAVTTGEAEFIMLRDPETDYCVKFDDGLCSVHKDKGTNFLGDACHFYPRISRKMGDNNIMSGALSCPEIARMTLLTEDAFDINETEIDRLPEAIVDYLPENISEKDSVKIVTALISMCNSNEITSARAMARLVSITTTLEFIKNEQWGDGIEFFIKMADGKLPPPENSNLGRNTDLYRLLQTFSGLVYASKDTERPRLEKVITNIQQALEISIDPKTLDIMQEPGKENHADKIDKIWHENEGQLEPILKRWIQAQISMSLFPFSGFGETPVERAKLMAIRYATVKLALVSNIICNGKISDAEIIETVQPISRFMDHLADPELSLNLYKEAGWLKEANLRGLIGDI